jgi:hypothetical protein
MQTSAPPPRGTPVKIVCGDLIILPMLNIKVIVMHHSSLLCIRRPHPVNLRFPIVFDQIRMSDRVSISRIATRGKRSLAPWQLVDNLFCIERLRTHKLRQIAADLKHVLIDSLGWS